MAKAENKKTGRGDRGRFIYQGTLGALSTFRCYRTSVLCRTTRRCWTESGG